MVIKTDTQPFDLSLIIPTYNTCKLVTGCVTSILAHTYGLRCEIIVVDDASSDDTVESLQSKFPQIRVIRNPINLGYGGAANKGLAAANGRYLAVLNSDIEIIDDALVQLAAFLDFHPDAGAVGPKLLNPDGTWQKSVSRHPSVIANFIRLMVPRELLEHEYVLNGVQWTSEILGWNLGRLAKAVDAPTVVECLMGAFFLVRREVYEKTYGFDPEGFYLFAEESDWFLRMQHAGWKVYYLPDADVIHSGSQTVGQIKYRYYIQQYKSFLRFYEKHSSQVTVLTYKMLLSAVFGIRASYCRMAALFSSKNKHELLRNYEMYLTIIKLFFDPKLRAQNVIREMQFRYIPTSRPY